MQQNDVNNMLNDLKKNSVDSEKVAAAAERLSDSQKRTLSELMADPELLKKFMASPKAQSILEMLKNGR